MSNRCKETALTTEYLQGRVKEATAILQDAVKIDPMHSGAIQNLARLHIQQGDAPTARVLLEELLNRSHTGDTGSLSETLALSAVAWVEADAVKALRQAQKAVMLRPGESRYRTTIELCRKVATD